MKFNIKYLMAVSTVILAMIGAGGAINANNNNVHASSDPDYLLDNPSVQKEVKENTDQQVEAQKKSDQQVEPEREQTALQEMQVGDSDPDLANDPTIRHFLHKHGYTNHQIKKAVHDNSQSVLDKETDDPNSKVNKRIDRENRLEAESVLGHSHSKRHYRKGIKRYHHKRIAKRANRKSTNHKAKRNRKIRKRVNKRSPKRLSYYNQGRKLGISIHNKDDNYGGVQYLLNNKKLFNKKFDNGYFKGYTTADPSDDESPAPRAKVAFKVAKTYQSSHNKAFKRGIRDSFRSNSYGKFNKRYSHNKSYKSGYHYFWKLERRSVKD